MLAVTTSPNQITADQSVIPIGAWLQMPSIVSALKILELPKSVNLAAAVLLSYETSPRTYFDRAPLMDQEKARAVASMVLEATGHQPDTTYTPSPVAMELFKRVMFALRERQVTTGAFDFKTEHLPLELNDFHLPELYKDLSIQQESERSIASVERLLRENDPVAYRELDFYCLAVPKFRPAIKAICRNVQRGRATRPDRRPLNTGSDDASTENLNSITGKFGSPHDNDLDQALTMLTEVIRGEVESLGSKGAHLQLTLEMLKREYLFAHLSTLFLQHLENGSPIDAQRLRFLASPIEIEVVRQRLVAIRATENKFACLEDGTDAVTAMFKMVESLPPPDEAFSALDQETRAFACRIFLIARNFLDMNIDNFGVGRYLKSFRRFSPDSRFGPGSLTKVAGDFLVDCAPFPLGSPIEQFNPRRPEDPNLTSLDAAFAARDLRAVFLLTGKNFPLRDDLATAFENLDRFLAYHERSYRSRGTVLTIDYLTEGT